MDSVLIIDDDALVHTSVVEHLGGLVGEIIHASSPEEGLRLAMSCRPALILLDINMPRMDGLKVCRHLKESSATRDIPVLFLTIDSNVQHIAKALECGAADYIMKPFNPVELKARVRAALRTKKLIDLLKEQARIDALTGISNRAALDEALRSSVSMFERTGHPLSLLMIDIDHFKAINDRSGHGVGDEVLRCVGAMIRTCCRPSDTAGRFGGDEFGVILGGTDYDAGRMAAERLLKAIRGLKIFSEGGSVTVTASAGLAAASLLDPNFGPSDLVKVADDALYRAKQAGRDRLVVAS
jgi:diguanylate cyclase (GGDEF)-like protein